MTANGCVGNEIFEIGVSKDAGTHGNRKGSDALDLTMVVDSEKHVVVVGLNELVEPIARNLAFVFAAAGQLNQ